MPPIQTVPQVTGNLTATVLDPAGTAPTEIIRRGDGFRVNAQWRLDGFGVPFINPAFRWRLRLRVESLGGGFEGDLPIPPGPPVIEPFVPVSGHVYNRTIVVGPIPVTVATGAYKLVVLLNMQDGAGNELPLAGFQEGPTLMFIV